MAFDKRSLDDYVPVTDRILEFRKLWPGGSLRGTYEIIRNAAGEMVAVAYRAEAFRGPEDQAPGVGCAWEVVPGRTPYTRGSELQNAETSAWGRAIVAVGAADAQVGVASRDEVMLRQAEQQTAEQAVEIANEQYFRQARAQRNAPPEVREDGSATEAEQVRMVHGREPGTERYHQPPPDEREWQDEPGQPLDPPAEKRPGSILPQQKTAMFAQFNLLKIRDRESQLDFMQGVLGWRPSHRDELSLVEAKAVLAALDKRSRDL